MSVEKIRVIFSAILRLDQFATQVVRLGGIYPEIEISLIDSATGLHEFSIQKNLPHTHPSLLDPAIAEATYQIELFWDVLAYVRDTVIKPTGEIFYEFRGIRHNIVPNSHMSLFGNATLTGLAGEGWFAHNEEHFHKRYDLDLLRRLNFIRAIDEPISKFISLYSLLSSIANDDKQREIDKKLLEVDPTIAIYQPPGRQQETIYTRLRNELAHRREGSNIINNHHEITLHLPKFEWIVKELVRRRIEVV